MSARYQRGVLLYSQHRYDLAADEFRAALAEDPGHGGSHAFLAICLAERGQHDAAEREAAAAIGADPEDAFAHYAKARTENQRGKHELALASMSEAVRLEPEDADYAAFRAALYLQLDRPQEALAEAERGLASDPEHVNAQNIRSMTLVRLGRRAEAGQALEGALQRSPENALTHANVGWTHLHANRPREASASFREALRIDPTLDWARSGMIDSLRARNPVYRGILAYFLWLQRMSSRSRWFVVAGIYFVGRLISTVGKHWPAAEPWMTPVAVVYGLFVWMTWLGEALSDLALLSTRDGRLLLDRFHRWRAQTLAALIGVGLTLALVAALTSWWLLFGPAVGVVALSLPAMATFGRRAGWPRLAMGAWTALAALGVVLFATLSFATDVEKDAHALATGSALCGLVGALLASFSSWVLPRRES
jgi:tetratricopeptide (TPR) repeat protein